MISNNDWSDKRFLIRPPTQWERVRDALILILAMLGFSAMALAHLAGFI